MLAAIKQWFEQVDFTDLQTSEDQCNLNQHAVQKLAAALLIEIALTDENFDERERSTLCDVLERVFDLPSEQLDELIKLAQAEQSDASSLYQFTREVNQRFDLGQKYQLVVAMWRVAFADEELDKYEESRIRKISELIYLSHPDFMRAKHQARSEHDKLKNQ